MLTNTLLMALRSIRQNIMRSVLTVLGIVIGVASVVALVTIGQGASEQVAREIGSMGENLLMIRPGGRHRPGMPHTLGKSLTADDVAAIAREVSGIEHAAPVAMSSRIVIFGNANTSTSITGTTAAYIPCRGYVMATGRAFSPKEDHGSKPVCILGATVVEALFGKSDPLGQRVRVGKMPCMIIGTLAPKGENAMGMDQDDVVLLPVRVFQRRIVGNDDVGSISVSVSKERATSVVAAEITALMRERRGIATGDGDDFEVRDLQEIATAIQQTTGVMTSLLSAIAAVSLLVGGIGIMNIMLVSVTERTREIGIRMAIGATRSEVRLQFLVEAAVLSGMGGIIGLFAGNGSAYLAAAALSMPFVPSPAIAVVALLFSTGVGVLFGFLPAHRASRLDPMEALRHE